MGRVAVRVPGAGVRPRTRPLRQSHPPIWVAANAGRAVARDARPGLPRVMTPLPTLRWRQLGIYRAAPAAAGRAPPADLPTY